MHSAAGGATKSPLQLPRQLDRPAFEPERTRQAIISADPDLEDVPLPFIRHSLRDKLHEMVIGRNSLSPSHVPTHYPVHLIPRALTVPLLKSSATASFPTHALAICAKDDPGQPALIFPIHCLVFSAHCSLTLPSCYEPNESAIHLPIQRLELPSPRAFSILYEYMYTQRLDGVLKKLIPLPPDFLSELSHTVVIEARGSKSTIFRLGMHLYACESGSVAMIMTHASHVKDLWHDMVALRMYLFDLWDTLDLAWDIVLCALHLASGRQRQNPFVHRDFL
ncbi:hypothetical protein CPB85DRAFT_1226186 [Mucidula mucida]|nr:hypothetical protein CPB85DRAFT_1239097 [Mucidula mucida]KAF8903852.1 hypothetical protein CPB85DRAFT_1226186 [Mucidula mucida]